jgi:hypothetical protein
MHEKAAVAKSALKQFLFKRCLPYSLSFRSCLMKLFPALVSPAFFSVAVLYFSAGAVLGQADLPLPSVRGTEGGSARELQRPAPPSQVALQTDPFSVPAPLPLPPEPAPFPSFPPVSPDPNPLELDLRKRANTSLVPEGPNPTEDAALQLRDRVRYRELKARVLAQPEVRSSLEAVQKARSDGELRDAWRRHYALFFPAMRVLDKSLEPLIAQREKEALSPLAEKLPRPAGRR